MKLFRNKGNLSSLKIMPRNKESRSNNCKKNKNHWLKWNSRKLYKPPVRGRSHRLVTLLKI